MHRGVYAVGHPALEKLAQLQGALLACGDGAVISHGTAAALWGIWDRWPRVIDVTVPRQAGRKIDGVRCRRCRYPSPEEITAHLGIACTTPARVLVDVAGMLGTASTRRAVERSAVIKLLDLGALDLSLHNAKGRRGIRPLQAILADWRTKDGELPDVRSDFEALALPRLVQMGLPRPRCNTRIVIEGEALEVDFLWEASRLVVEADGGSTHENPVAFQRDRHRDQLLVSSGYRVIRITWDQIRNELDAVVERIGRALEL